MILFQDENSLKYQSKDGKFKFNPKDRINELEEFVENLLEINKQSNQIILNLLKSKHDKEEQLREINETVKNNQFMIKSIEKNISIKDDDVSYEEPSTDSKGIQVCFESPEKGKNRTKSYRRVNFF